MRKGLKLDGTPYVVGSVPVETGNRLRGEGAGRNAYKCPHISVKCDWLVGVETGSIPIVTLSKRQTPKHNISKHFKILNNNIKHLNEHIKSPEQNVIIEQNLFH